MAAYRITVHGTRVVVGTEHEAVLICKNLDVARRVVADAERVQRIPTLQLLAQHAARLNAALPALDAVVRSLGGVGPAVVGIVPTD